jgi:hypothetical protein
VYHGAAIMRKPNETIFSIIFKKGMADRNRLPLSHVLATLREIDSMIREVGIKVQREKGVEKPDGDFGIELLAGRVGLAFQKGSIKSASAITKDIENGTETLKRIIETTDIVEKKRTISLDGYRAPVVRGLAVIGRVQEDDRTELRIQLAPTRGKVIQTRFSEKGIEAIKKMAATKDFSIEALTVFGKLRAIVDASKTDKDDDIWGELIEDSGNKWRIKFNPLDLDKAKGLFTKQVTVFGDATYFKTKLPRIDVKTITEDTPRDYVAAFEHFSREYEEIFGDRDPEEIIRSMRG